MSLPWFQWGGRERVVLAEDMVSSAIGLVGTAAVTSTASGESSQGKDDSSLDEVQSQFSNEDMSVLSGGSDRDIFIYNHFQS